MQYQIKTTHKFHTQIHTIMAKFNATTWKNELKKQVSELEVKISELELACVMARKEWKASNSSEDRKDYYASLKALESAKDEYDRVWLLSQDKLYCNECLYSDVNPYEVIGYANEKTLIIRAMRAEITEDSQKELRDSFVVGGFCGHFDNELQEWTITSNENEEAFKVRLHKDGCYYAAGCGTRFRLNIKPVKFYDYNF